MLKARLNMMKYLIKAITSMWRLLDKQIVADTFFVLHSRNDSRCIIDSDICYSRITVFRCTVPTVHSSLSSIIFCVLKTVI